MFISPFNPHWGTNQVLTAAATSALATIDRADHQVRILNTGANIAYVRIGDSTTVATTADMPIAANGGSIITKGPAHSHIAYISALGTTLQVMTGVGN